MDIRTTKKSPNINKGRGSWKPDIIVCHISEGYYDSGCDWLCNPVSKASTHFFVSKKGEVSQLVDIQDTAWGNGTSDKEGDSRFYGYSSLQTVRERRTNANKYTISIEHEGFFKEGSGSLTEAQTTASAELIRYIIKEVKRIYDIDIPVDRQHIVGHSEIAPKWKPNCPGRNFPFDEIIKLITVDFSPSRTNTSQTPIQIRKIPDYTLSAMVKAGVINSPDYWKNLKVPYLYDLFQKAGEHVDSRIHNGINDFDTAFGILVDVGIINMPERWIENAQTVKHVRELIINIANKSKSILHKIVQAEAGGEDEKGKILVVNVIQNRVKSKDFPNSVYDVVFQKNQFQPMRNGAYEKAKPSKATIAAVDKALDGADYSQGALFFRTVAGSKGSWHETKLKKLFSHGCHSFYQ